MSNEKPNEDSDFSDLDKTILTGRIYPAIQSCVGNRYKIIVGYFAVIGFLLAIGEEKVKKLVDSGAILFLAWIFTFLILHNFVNYWRNSHDQTKHEHGKKYIVPPMETSSSIIMWGLIWCGYFFLKRYITA